MAMLSLPRLATLSPRSVLIIDDNQALCDVYSVALRLAGIAAVTACDEATGWAAATTSSPDLILLDIDLGKSNGFDLLARLRAHRWHGIAPRIAMFTNFDSLEFRERARSGGADAYLVKASLRLPQLVEAVRDLTEGRCPDDRWQRRVRSAPA